MRMQTLKPESRNIEPNANGNYHSLNNDTQGNQNNYPVFAKGHTTIYKTQ